MSCLSIHKARFISVESVDVQDERQLSSSPCGDKCYGIDRSLSVDDTLNGTTAIKLFVYV